MARLTWPGSYKFTYATVSCSPALTARSVSLRSKVLYRPTTMLLWPLHMNTSPKVRPTSVALVAPPAHVAHATVAVKSPPPAGSIGSRITFQVESARTLVEKVLA